jgi:hypothetical protein
MTDLQLVLELLLAFAGGLFCMALMPRALTWYETRTFSTARAEAMNLPHPRVSGDTPVPPANRGHTHRFHQAFGWMQGERQQDVLLCGCGAHVDIVHRELCVH